MCQLSGLWVRTATVHWHGFSANYDEHVCRERFYYENKNAFRWVRTVRLLTVSKHALHRGTGFWDLSHMGCTCWGVYLPGGGTCLGGVPAQEVGVYLLPSRKSWHTVLYLCGYALVLCRNYIPKGRSTVVQYFIICLFTFRKFEKRKTMSDQPNFNNPAEYNAYAQAVHDELCRQSYPYQYLQAKRDELDYCGTSTKNWRSSLNSSNTSSGSTSGSTKTSQGE